MMTFLDHTTPSVIRFAPNLAGKAGPSALALWLDRQRQRIRLSQLDEHLLDDIGVSRIEAVREARRWD